MKKLTFILLLCSSLSVFAQKTNFSGTWLINKTKTDFAGSNAAEWVVPKMTKVDQQADKLILTRVNTDNQLKEEPAIIETLAFDGTPFKRKSAETVVTTSIHWLNDVSFSLSRKGSQTATEIWTLEDSGKTLVVNRSIETSQGFYNIKCFYDKQ